jgi:hypothetical protein
MGELKCRFGCAHPIGIYHIPKGCACWPDPVQALCAQHFIKAQSDGPITLIVELTVEGKHDGEHEASRAGRV